MEEKELINNEKIKITLIESEKKTGLLKQFAKNKKNNKIEGYIFYKQESGEYKPIAVSNFKQVYKYKNKAHILNKIEGIIEGKPFYIIDNKIPISLNSKIKSNLKDVKGNNYIDGYDLCYDSKVFYTALDYINISNLTEKEEKTGFNLFELIKEYWIVAVGIIAFILMVVLQNSGVIRLV